MKRIICCCDGTWNHPGQVDNGAVTKTNVQKIAHLICSSDPNGVIQLTHYHPGVGTSGNWWQRLMGGISGSGLDSNIIEAYRFIMLNYEPGTHADERGDEIYLFGFSRGAYTARSLAGFIVNCGILRKENLDKLNEAFTFYRDRREVTNPNSTDAIAFRKKNSHPPAVYFIGVWDTVGALGVPLQPFMFLNKRKYRFHDTQLSSIVRFAYHALAADEHRAIFNATLWELSERGKNQPVGHQEVEQVWFTGSHGNVGGGYQDTGLSDYTLEWMVAKAGVSGLAFNIPPKDFYKIDVVNGTLVNSNSFWWALLHYFVTFYRVIFRFDPVFIKQSVAGSVYQRIEATGYRPKNLPAQNSLSKSMSIGEIFNIDVNAFMEYSGSAISVIAGESYQFSYSKDEKWKDWFISCGPEGYFNPLASLWGLRVRKEKCFCLCGIYGRSYSTAFKIASGLHHTITENGIISFFANDAVGWYFNNSGSVTLIIQRIT